MNKPIPDDLEKELKETKMKTKLFEAYLFVYDEFATDTVEVAKKIGLPVNETFKLLKSCKLLTSLLIVDGVSGSSTTRKNHPGVAYTWQCYENNDNISREDAIDLFNKEQQKEATK